AITAVADALVDRRTLLERVFRLFDIEDRRRDGLEVSTRDRWLVLDIDTDELESVVVGQRAIERTHRSPVLKDVVHAGRVFVRFHCVHPPDQCLVPAVQISAVKLRPRVAPFTEHDAHARDAPEVLEDRALDRALEWVARVRLTR